MFHFLRSIVLITTLTLLFSGAMAKAVTLGELTHNCEQLESYWRINPTKRQSHTIPNDVDGAICIGFMLPFIDLSGLVGVVGDPDVSTCYTTQGGRKLTGGPRCRPMLGICFPEGVSYSQILAVFLAYARNHAAQWHENAGTHYLRALVAAFPCKDGNLETPK